MNQKPNQEVEYISGFREEEVVEDSDFDESVNGQEKTDKLTENQQNKPEEEQPKKSKRPRKTIEQEIAELDAKRERLMEKKRRQDAHEKIVFGAAAIKVFKLYCHIEKNKNGWEIWKDQFKKVVLQKDKDILEDILEEIEKDK